MAEKEDIEERRRKKDPKLGRPGAFGVPLTPGETDDILFAYALLGNQSEVARRVRASVTTVRRIIENNGDRLAELRKAVADIGRGELAYNFVAINRAIGRRLAEADGEGEQPKAREIYELTRSMTLIAQTSRLLDDQPTAIVETTRKGNVAEMRSRMVARIESLAEGDPKLKRALVKRYDKAAGEDIQPIEELDELDEEDRDE